MNYTIFTTVLSGVLVYVFGQLILKLVIEPVQDLRKTIGQTSHALIQRANVIQNPGVPEQKIMDETSDQLRTLSSQLQSHLYLVPSYSFTAKLFNLPSFDEICKASSDLIGLSNSIFQVRPNIHEINAKRVENICDLLDIYLPDESRWPK
jgi:hypothetical protein